MRSVQAAGHGHHPHSVHVHRGMRLVGRAPRPVAPEALTLFSERMDDERDYENTVRDFILLHDLTHSADDFDS